MPDHHHIADEGKHRHRLWDRNRLMAFTDGVFAIAATLLAFNLHLPAHYASFYQALHEIRFALLNFFVSFAVIGYIWLGHNRLFHYIEDVDRRIFLLNLLFLATVSFLPFASNALLNTSGDRGAVIFYAASIFAATFTEQLIWLYARRHPVLLDEHLEPRTKSFITAVYSYTPLVFLASIVVAVFSAAAAEYVWLLLLVERFGLRYYYHVTTKQAE